jgi:tagatose 1,6-diphosphate aldolase
MTGPKTGKCKLDRLRGLTDATGRLVLLAIDHRNNLRAALSSAAKREVSTTELIEFKRAVVRNLSSASSGVLLDPEYGLSAAKERAPDCGLLLAYEKSGYDNTRPGRSPDLIANQSVARLQTAGAAAVKILLHYSNLEDPSVNEEKKAFIERVGAECQAHALPFFLEIITYDPSGSLSPAELAARRPALIGEVVSEFSQSSYGVDVLKLELPVAANLVKDSSASSASYWSHDEALHQIRQALSSATLPVVFLSGGVSVNDFTAGLELVAASGIPFHGVLCGRAIWNDAIKAYAAGDRGELERWLAEAGRANLAAVCGRVERLATPLPEREA